MSKHHLENQPSSCAECYIVDISLSSPSLCWAVHIFPFCFQCWWSYFYVLMVVLAYRCLTTLTIPVPENNNKCACSRGLSPDNFKSYVEQQLSSGFAMFCARVHGLLSMFVSGCRRLSCYAYSQTTLIWTNQLSCGFDTSKESLVLKCRLQFLFPAGSYVRELKSLLFSCIQMEVMSAVKIGVGRQEMNNMPATALMTVWPEETVAPTTRLCVKVCNFKSICLNVLLTHRRDIERIENLFHDLDVWRHQPVYVLNAVLFFHHTGPGLVKCSWLSIYLI